MSKRKPAAPAAPAPTETPAVAALTAEPTARTAPAPAQAPRLQQTVTEDALHEDALSAIKKHILSEPAAPPEADNTETPGDDEVTAATDDIITPEAEADDEPGDAAEESPAEPAAEDETASDESTEPEADEDLAALAEKSNEELEQEGKEKGWSPSFIKARQKYRRQYLEAKAQFEQKLQELESRAPAEPEAEVEPSPAPAAPQVATGPEEAMLNELAQLKRAIKTIDENPDGMTLGNQNYSPDQLLKAREEYAEQVEQLRVNLTLHRRDVQQRLAAEHAQVVKDHAWLKSKSDPHAATVRHALTQYPVLRSIPDGVTMLAEAMEYRRLKAAGKLPATQGTVTTAPVRKPAPAAKSPSRPGAAPLAMPRKEAGLSAAHQKVMKTGSVEDATALLAQII